MNVKTVDKMVDLLISEVLSNLCNACKINVGERGLIFVILWQGKVACQTEAWKFCFLDGILQINLGGWHLQPGIAEVAYVHGILDISVGKEHEAGL